MRTKKKSGGLDKESIFMASVWLLCAILATVQYALLVYTAEGPIDAEVTGTSPATESYGASVTASSGVLLSWRALEEADSRGSLMLRQDWGSIELESTVPYCRNISVWLAKRGWRPIRFDCMPLQPAVIGNMSAMGTVHIEVMPDMTLAELSERLSISRLCITDGGHGRLCYSMPYGLRGVMPSEIESCFPFKLL